MILGLLGAMVPWIALIVADVNEFLKSVGGIRECQAVSLSCVDFI